MEASWKEECLTNLQHDFPEKSVSQVKRHLQGATNDTSRSLVPLASFLAPRLQAGVSLQKCRFRWGNMENLTSQVGVQAPHARTALGLLMLLVCCCCLQTTPLRVPLLSFTFPSPQNITCLETVQLLARQIAIPIIVARKDLLALLRRRRFKASGMGKHEVSPLS